MWQRKLVIYGMGLSLSVQTIGGVVELLKRPDSNSDKVQSMKNQVSELESKLDAIETKTDRQQEFRGKLSEFKSELDRFPKPGPQRGKWDGFEEVAQQALLFWVILSVVKNVPTENVTSPDRRKPTN